MRKDLNKVLCERERVGSGSGYADVRHLKKYNSDDLENAPIRESMKKRYAAGWSYKQFNEHLNPLYGIVRKNVGRPWDKVYSELCKVFDTRSVINQHILFHLNQFVEQNVQIRDEQLYINHSWGNPELLKDSWTEYYVHPRTGLLLRNKHYLTSRQKSNRRRQNNPALVTQYQLQNSDELHKIDGIWYLAELADLVPPTIVEYVDAETGETKTRRQTHYFYDAVSNTTVCWGSLNRDNTYRKSKKQLSHQQLKFYNLLNAA